MEDYIFKRNKKAETSRKGRYKTKQVYRPYMLKYSE